MYKVSNIHLRGSELLTVCHVSNVLTASDAMKSDEKSLVHQVRIKIYIRQQRRKYFSHFKLGCFQKFD